MIYPIFLDGRYWYKCGVRCKTASGRTTDLYPPYPKKSSEAAWSRTLTARAVWLLREALLEARARGDDTNEMVWEHELNHFINKKKKHLPPPATIASAELQVFDKEFHAEQEKLLFTRNVLRRRLKDLPAAPPRAVSPSHNLEQADLL